MKPCLHPGCPRLAMSRHPRCSDHEKAFQAARNRAPERQAYRDPAYIRARKALTDGRIPCVDCGTRQELTVDHITPLSLGGTNDLTNLTVRCRPCNSRKGANRETR